MDSFRTISLHWRRFLGGLALVCIALYLVLLIPELEPPVPKGAQKSPFVWSQNELWSSLERDFIKSRSLGCDRLQLRIDSSISDINQLLDSITSIALNPQARHFDVLENQMFSLAPKIAACTERLSFRCWEEKRGVAGITVNLVWKE